MAKRYTEKEDAFIIAYFDAVGPYIGPHDLGRSEASVKARAKFLKESGAWSLMEQAWEFKMRYRVEAGHIPRTSPVWLEYLEKQNASSELRIV